MDVEEKNLMDDMLEQVVLSSEILKETEPDNRNAEAKVYDTLVKSVMEYEKQTQDISYQYDKLELERTKFEEEMKFKREIEQARLDIEKKKSDAEIQTLWAKVGVAGATLAANIGLGILYLKANMKYGGMIGKDGKNWFDDIKKIKL